MKLKVLFLLSLCMLVMLCSCETSEPVETTEPIETTTIAEETELEFIPSDQRTAENRRFFDDVDFPFVLDENAVGTWDVCGYVDTIEDYPEKNWDTEYYLKKIVFNNQGGCAIFLKNGKNAVDWTADMVLDKPKQINSGYVIKAIDDVEYLFFQWKSGDYTYMGVEPTYYVFKRGEPIILEKFQDIRSYAQPEFLNVNESQYKIDDIKTYSYSDDITFEGAEEYAMEILEKAKNPGLGVRELHARGITGEGVNAAIIDQNLVTTEWHPEYDGKIAGYRDFGTEAGEDIGSMHGPSVASLLVGETVGTAPGAKLYYAAAPSWTRDSQYYADALYWIIEENEKLPDGEKIRVVSISAAPSGDGSPFEKNLGSYTKAVEAANAAGILVLDCRNDVKSGVIMAAYGNVDEPDDYTQYKLNFPQEPSNYLNKNWIYVPTSLRTSAGQYTPGDSHYTYWGQGGLSWGIPYASGVLAMGWQVDPSLDKDEIVKILFDTCYVNENGAHIINPTAFIEYIEVNLNK